MTTSPTETPPRVIDVDEIRARHDAVQIKGPYRWRGNTDSGQPRLVGHVEYPDGRKQSMDLLGTINEDRTADDPGAKSLAEYLRDVRIEDGYELLDDDGRTVLATSPDFLGTNQWMREFPGKQKRTRWRRYTDAEIAERVQAEYIDDGFDGVRTDTVLAFVDAESHFYKPANSLAVYEVAVAQGLPEDTPRDHPKVYRADIVGIRDPQAIALEHSWSDVDDLLVALDRARIENALLQRKLADQEKHNIESRRSLCEQADQYKAERDGARAALKTKLSTADA